LNRKIIASVLVAAIALLGGCKRSSETSETSAESTSLTTVTETTVNTSETSGLKLYSADEYSSA